MDWPALASCDLCPTGTNGLGSVWSCDAEPNGCHPQLPTVWMCRRNDTETGQQRGSVADGGGKQGELEGTVVSFEVEQTAGQDAIYSMSLRRAGVGPACVARSAGTTKAVVDRLSSPSSNNPLAYGFMLVAPFRDVNRNLGNSPISSAIWRS